MTRNLYLGADINRPVVAALTAQAQGKTPQQVLDALAHATHVTRQIVDQTDFSVRARLIASEFAETRPDLVGLQEVACGARARSSSTRSGSRTRPRVWTRTSCRS